MLVLSRKRGEKVVVGGGITITLLEVCGNRVRLGIDAPPNTRILRSELAEWLETPLVIDNPSSSPERLASV